MVWLIEVRGCTGEGSFSRYSRDNYLHSRVSDWGVWRGTPLEIGHVTSSLPCSEPLLRLASLAIAHGWGCARRVVVRVG